MPKPTKPLDTYHSPQGVKLVRGAVSITISPDEFATVQQSVDRFIFCESVYQQHGYPHGDPRTTQEGNHNA